MSPAQCQGYSEQGGRRMQVVCELIVRTSGDG
jgi:hypothetical protein